MDEWKKAELKRQEELSAEAEVLMKYLREAKERYPDADLTVVVDNDSWHLQVGIGGLSEDEDADEDEEILREGRPKELDCGPARLSMMLAVGHGFKASRP